MSRLIMASNQCDVISHSPLRPLSETLFGVAKQKNALWLGWSGEISKDDKRSIRQRELAECELCSWSLTAEEYGDYYHGYVHKQLWPVFHNRPDLAVFQSGAFEAYRRYNERVAEQIADHLCPDDSVWVHDYHLMGVARNLKEAGYLNRCGFFLHHAFPPGEIFRALPEHDWLMQSLFYYDLVGFQSRNDASHFVTWISRRYRTEKVSETLFRVNGHLLRVGVFPCGVAASPPPAGVRKERPRWVVSTDVISDASGIAWRLAALRQLLEQHPQYLHDVTLVQVSDPSRASPCFTPGLRHQLERLCGELNGSYGDFDWSPVNYLHNDTPETARRESLYSQSCIGLFTPFCEGMSLEAKKYVLAQDPADPGVLILSHFTGAAEQLHDALLVNPYDAGELSEALHCALSMPLAERKRRHQQLRQQICHYNHHWWVSGFLNALEADTETVPDPFFLPAHRLFASPGRY